MPEKESAAAMVTSRVDGRHRTTLPKAVRVALGVDAGGRVGYVVEGDTVRMVNFDDAFLVFLAEDLAAHPEVAKEFPADLLARARALAAGTHVDHDVVIEGETAL